MNDFENIQYGNYVYPDIHARDARLKIRYLISQTKSEQKGS